jgi:DNA uptake protein ComE-like DNA-binding protein
MRFALCLVTCLAFFTPGLVAAQLIDVNSAKVEALVAGLPGVGDVRSKAIVANRPYLEKVDLVKKNAVPQNVFDGIKDKIALANINTTTAKDMIATLPGIGDARAAAIVKGRPYGKIEDLVGKKVLTQAQLDPIKTLITVK